jgi:hypothetical protein
MWFTEQVRRHRASIESNMKIIRAFGEWNLDAYTERSMLRRPMSGLLGFGRDRLTIAFKRRHERVPGQDGAFDARRELMHAGKHR